jgi:Uncharacterized protein conserved in bacteria (DUF2188)
MPGRDIETFLVHDDRCWMNRLEGGEIFPEVYELRSDAVIAGRELAKKRKVGHIIRNEVGSITQRNSYG